MQARSSPQTIDRIRVFCNLVLLFTRLSESSSVSGVSPDQMLLWGFGLHAEGRRACLSSAFASSPTARQPLRPSACRLQVKSKLPDALDRFLSEINRSKLRVRRPSKFVFLCGGEIKDGTAPAQNLRDYLWRIRGIGSKSIAIVLAESAQQLYRDSGYSDLITFEEDIARIASIVLVISESAGSLAELGAFCSNPVISPVLRVLISNENFDQESFIRWGPVERIQTPHRDRVGVFPWIQTDNPDDLTRSADPIFSDIEAFMEEHVKAAPSSTQYPSDPAIAQFYDIIWMIYIANAISPGRLLDSLQKIYPTLTLKELRRKLYTLRVAKWVCVTPYGSQDYYYLNEQQDPFDYSFNIGVKEKDPVRRVLTIRDELFSDTPNGAIARVRDLRDSGK